MARARPLSVVVAPLAVVCLVACGETAPVTIVQPSGTTYTNGVVRFQMEAPGSPDRVELLVDGTLLASVAAPYVYDWDTRATPEGSHQVTARVPDRAGTSDPVVVVVDRTPPVLVGRAPAANDEDAPFDEPIRLSFSEPMAAVEVTLATPDDPALDHDVTVDGMEVTIAYSPPVPAVVAVDVARAADRAGNVAAIGAWSFRIPAWRRLGGAIAEDPGRGQYFPAVAVDGQGRALVTWFEGPTPETRRVYVRRFAAGAWEPLGGPLNIVADRRAAHPRVAVDGADRPVVAWEESDGANGVGVHVARWEQGAWRELGSLGEGRNPDVTVDAAGNPLVAWLAPRTLEVRRWDGAAWQPLGPGIAVIPADAAYAPPSLAIDGSGAVMVAASVRDATSANVMVWRFGDGAWQPVNGGPVDVTLAAPALLPSLAIDDAGTPLVAWTESGNVHVRRLDAQGGLLGRPLDLSVANDATHPQLARGGAGPPFVVWSERNGPFHRAYAARWDGAAWRMLAPAANRLEDGDATTRGVARDASGALFLAFHELEQGDLDRSLVHVSRYNAGPEPPHGLATRPQATASCRFDGFPPLTLSATGCYADLARRRPVPGFVPFTIRSQLWSDGAEKRRYLMVPDNATIIATDVGAWLVPDATILLKEFYLETVAGDPRSLRPLETRFLVIRRGTSAPTVDGFSYMWNDHLQDGVLNPDETVYKDYTVVVGGTSTIHTHTFPSRAQCRRCHNPEAGLVLGVQTVQLNGPLDYGITVDNQLRALAHVGLVAGLGGAPEAGPRLPDPLDPTESLEARVRSQLHSNCAQCHRRDPDGEMPSMDLRFHVALAQTGLCRVLTPGNHTVSPIWLRDSSRPGMPPLATLIPNPLADERLAAWIDGMATCP